MKHILFAVLCIVVVITNCTGQQHDKWQVTFNGGKKIYNAVIDQVTQDSIQITGNGVTERFPLADLNRFENNNKESSMFTTGLIGAVVGGGIGYVIGSIEDKHQNDVSDEVTRNKYIYGGAGFGIGLTAGLFMGTTSSVDVIYDVAGLDDKEKRSMIENIMADKGSGGSSTGSLPDIVYLRKGGTMKGIVSENEQDSTLTVRTFDGSVFTYKRSEILMIESVDPTAKTAQLENTEMGASTEGLALEIHLGTSLPMGDFSAQTSGNALPGFLFNGNVTYPLFSDEEKTIVVQSIGSIALSLNSLDVEVPQSDGVDIGYWVTSWGLGGIRTLTQLGDFMMYASGQAGIMIGSVPTINILATNSSFKQYSNSPISFAYKAGIGTIFNDRFLFDVNYINSKAEYDLTQVTVNGSNTITANGKYTQQVTMVTLTLGLIF